MNRIIALYGAGEKGKTETINILIDLLCNAKNGGNMPVPSTVDRQQAFFYNNSTISICTKGDGAAEIQDNISYFQNNNCDIAICTTRTKGQPVAALQNFANSMSIQIEWQKKTYDLANQSAANLKQAQDIFNLL